MGIGDKLEVPTKNLGLSMKKLRHKSKKRYEGTYKVRTINVHTIADGGSPDSLLLCVDGKTVY